MKKLTAVVCLLLCLSALLCGCNNTTTTTAAPTTEPVTTAPVTTVAPTTAPNTNVTYTAYVVDQDGNPMAGVMIQFCDDANVCKLPVTSDAEGKVVVTYTPANYHVSVTVVPDGYTAEADGYYFEEGSTEITVKLTKN